MNLVIDSGNTYTKLGWFENTRLVETEHRITWDKLPLYCQKYPCEHLLFCSVSKKVTDFIELVQPSCPVLNLTNETAVPLGKNYKTPETLGADRLAAAVGASFLYPGRNLVVIDAGTCITYDLVTSQSTYEGGIISPGFHMRLQAMHQLTQRLPVVEPVVSPELIGKSTSECMQSGAFNGMLAEIQSIIERYRRERSDICVVICGGDAPFFESHLKLPIFAVPELVLIGLNRILLYNVA